jgi:site-specific DNA recombinase
MKKETANDTQKKTVIYCRVSTKEQVDEGNSLVTQERLCREYALSEGYEIAEIFIEKGESAKTAKRTELQRLLAFCGDRKNEVNALISYKVDRISRNIADYSYIKVKLKKHGIDIKSVSEHFEDTPAGRFMENIIANVSQFDNEVRTERSVGGMKEAQQEGRYVWRAPLGYDNTKIDNKSTIAPNSLAPLVKEAFELIALRWYPTEVVRLMMREKGLTDRHGNAITRSYFFRLLRNPAYKGTIRKFGIVANGKYEAIISDALFEDVQAVLKGRKNKIKHYQKENPDFPLRRFVLSPLGKQLTGYWSKGKRSMYPYYSFQHPGTTIRKESLEEKFMAFLSLFSFDTSHLQNLRAHLERHFGKQASSDKEGKVAIGRRIEEINQQIDVLIDLHGQGSISESIFSHRIQRLEVELEELQDLLKAKSDVEVNIGELLAHVEETLKAPHLFWSKSPSEIRRKFQVFDFPYGVVFDGEHFRTPKVCSLFKLKCIFGDEMSLIANLRGTGKNTVDGTSLPLSDEKLLETKEFWETVRDDAAKLYRIMSGLEEKQE